MKKRYFLTGLFLIVMACSEPPEKPKTEGNPQIVNLKLSEHWNLNSSDSNIVEVKVTDPSGVNDLDSVSMKVYDAASNEKFSAGLYDDGGLSGSTDLIAGDGVFRNHFLSTDISSQEGEFLFTFNVSDKMGNAANEVSRNVTFNFNSAPQLLNATSLDTLKSGAKPVVLSAVAIDADGSPENTFVFMDLLFNNNSVLPQPVELANDGNLEENGDIFAGDSVYTLKIDSTFAAAKKGLYTMVFMAKDEFGSESNRIQNNILIENKGGHILKTQVPDTVIRPAEIPIKALVNDPQGKNDIQRVYFELKASDGTYIETSTGEHYQQDMFDNGNTSANGDVTAGDLEYSVILQVTKNNKADVYTLEFYSVDKTSNISPMVNDTLAIQ